MVVFSWSIVKLTCIDIAVMNFTEMESKVSIIGEKILLWPPSY